MTTSTTVKGTLIILPGVHRDHYVLGSNGWMERVLFPHPTRVPAPQLNQQISVEKPAKILIARLEHGFDAI